MVAYFRINLIVQIWHGILIAQVPPKIRVFGQKLASEALGVQHNRWRRNLVALPTCTNLRFGTGGWVPCSDEMYESKSTSS